MKHKIIYTLLVFCLSMGHINAQVDCVQNFSVELDENGDGYIMASDLIPNVEFLISTGTVTYLIVPYQSGVINSGSDLISVNCKYTWAGDYIVEHTINGDLESSCSGKITVFDPLFSCPQYTHCQDPESTCLSPIFASTSYSFENGFLHAADIPVCDEDLNCTGTYAIAIGNLVNAPGLPFESMLSKDLFTEYITPLVLSYTENGVTEYRQTSVRIWENLACRIYSVPSVTAELDLTGEVTITPDIFLDSENTCTDITLAKVPVNGDVPTDFFDELTLTCDDLGYHDIYLKDGATLFVVSSQLFLADPLEVCGPILGPGDKLIKMSNNPPVGTYAGTKISVNGTDLPVSPTGKGWIINEDILVDGTNTLNFDAGPFTLNGVSTLDLVRLLRLIILDEYNTPKESIVMDIDDSGYNGIGDLVLTRKVILGQDITQDLINTLFIPKGFQFPSDFNPFDFDYDFTKYDFEKDDFDALPFRFEACKVGDFNGTAAVEDSLIGSPVTSTRDLDVFEVSDMDITAGVPFNFSLKYDSGEPIKGLLAALVSNGVKFQYLTSEEGDAVQYNIINDNEIRISFVALNVEAIENISFEITAISNSSGRLIDFLALKEGFPQEVIDENENVIKIEYLEEESVTSTVETELKIDVAIYPNPVSQKLMVSIPDGILGEVKVLDPMGKCLLIGNSDSNVLEFDVSDLSNGLYFVKVGSNKQSGNQSFIKVD